MVSAGVLLQFDTPSYLLTVYGLDVPVALHVNVIPDEVTLEGELKVIVGVATPSNMQ
jgi:hypothetical protein